MAGRLRQPCAVPRTSDLAQKSDRIKLFRLDVTDQASVEAAVRRCDPPQCGAIDVVVNNAGYGLMGPFEAQTDAQIRRQFETNMFRRAQRHAGGAAAYARAPRSGRIVNVGSAAGRMAAAALLDVRGHEVGA